MDDLLAVPQAAKHPPKTWTDNAATVAVVAVAAIAYVATTPSGIVGGDNPEFAALYGGGGVAHPSGYPLYVRWLRAWSWLPVSTPAKGAAIATAIAATGSLYLLARAIKAFRIDDRAAALALALYAFSPLAWTLSVQAEVFTMNVGAAAAIVWASAPEAKLRGPRRAITLGLLAGLALSNHLSCVLVAPIGLYGIVNAIRESRSLRARTASVACAIAALIVGLLPYASLPIFARTSSWPWVWGEPRDWSSFVRHVRRADYGTFSLASRDAQTSPGDQLASLAHSFTDNLHVVALLVAGVGALSLAFAKGRVREGREGSSRGFVWALVATLVVTGPLFVTRFNLPTEGLYHHVVRRFHLLPIAMSLPFLAMGFEVVIAKTKLGRRGVSTGLAVVVACAMVVAWPTVRESSRPTVDQHMRTVFALLPRDAILVTSGDHDFGGALYVQRALRQREDVTVVGPALVSTRWYGTALARMLGTQLEVKVVGRVVDPLSLAQALARIGRPLFFIDDVGKDRIPLERLRTAPWGPLVRYVPVSEDLPSPAELERDTSRLYASIDVDTGVADVTSWQAAVVKLYAVPWLAIGRAYEAAGDSDRARRNFDRARAIAPWMKVP